MTNAVLKVSNLSKDYGNRRVVNNVSFEIKAGEIFGFLGANGAGKSTTIKMIAGLTSISEGNVFILDHSIKSNFEHAIKDVGGMIETPTHFIII